MSLFSQRETLTSIRHDVATSEPQSVVEGEDHTIQHLQLVDFLQSRFDELEKVLDAKLYQLGYSDVDLSHLLQSTSESLRSFQGAGRLSKSSSEQRQRPLLVSEKDREGHHFFRFKVPAVMDLHPRSQAVIPHCLNKFLLSLRRYYVLSSKVKNVRSLRKKHH